MSSLSPPTITQHPVFTNDYFQRLLRTDRANSNIHVRNVHFRPACGKGENFTSELQRVTVTFASGENGAVAAPEQSVNFIVKCSLTSAGAAVEEMLQGLGLFDKEIHCYTKVLPAVEKLLLSIGDETRLSPRCLDASLEQSYLVFEDLADVGYTTLRRQQGLSFHHFQLLFTKLAKWHAATAVVVQNDPSILFAPYLAEQFVPSNESWKLIIHNSAIALADATQMMDDNVLQQIGVKIATVAPNLMERFFAATVRQPDSLNSIIHGDLWSSNIMFAYDASNTGNEHHPVDVLMVDFQIGAYTSPMRDVQHALVSSSAHEVRTAEWEQLIAVYHKELTETLRRFEFAARPVPTLENLVSEWKRHGAVAAYMLTYFMAVRQLELEGGADMEKLSSQRPGDREYRRDLVLRPESRESVEFLVRYCDEMGFYDIPE